MLRFQEVWGHHPYPAYPCDPVAFENQCAIRMGVALQGAGMSIDDYTGLLCYPNYGHDPRHILRAQELADWLLTKEGDVGKATKRKNVSAADYKDMNGIVFVKDGWGATDHIDVWNGVKGEMKGGKPEYFALGKEVWFWKLA